jgi:glyoxylase-like metal-dependent hydrolase (beta-lactamase superfamily II)
MELYSIPTGSLMIDGGAMFGIIPKVIWERMYPADERNLVKLTMRCLLVADGNRKVLFDSGMGDKQGENFLKHYYPDRKDTLIGSLKKNGFRPEDITDHVITHLHFDHCGGSIRYDENGKNPVTIFPNAVYWISRLQWNLARIPNRIESPSFLKENIEPIEKSGQLKLFDSEFGLTDNIRIRLFNGHTLGLATGLIKYKDKTLVNISDLMPMAGNIILSWISGYDTNPLNTLTEKQEFLEESLKNNYAYFFYHDAEKECCNLQRTPKGIRVDKVFTLNQFTGSEF